MLLQLRLNKKTSEVFKTSEVYILMLRTPFQKQGQSQGIAPTNNDLL